jgi:hypothetical protein
MSATKSMEISLFKQLDAILQGILSLAAIIYALGFIIVNSHYSSFGVTDYQLIQTRYIAAGLSYLFIHVGVASMIAITLIVIENQRMSVWLFVFLVMWGLFGTAVYLISESIINSFIVGASAGVIVLMGYQLWTVWTDTRNQWLDSMPDQSRVPFISIGVAIILCVSTLAWGRSFWPIMSSNLGGGRPNEAIFVFEANSIPIEGLPLIPMQNQTATEQLPILFDNASEYVVLVHTQSEDPVAVRIPKTIILSVIHAPSEAFGRKRILPALTPAGAVP